MAVTRVDPVRLRAIERLREMDAQLSERSAHLLSLAPDRPRATPLAELGAGLFAAEHTAERDDARSVEALSEVLVTVTRAAIEHFPENLFFDVDYLAQNLWDTRAPTDAARAQAIYDAGELIAELQHDYGCGTSIRFRYVHDFLYGFDWAKWVRKDPAQRHAVRPFDLEFLRYSRRRAAELCELIARDDAKYPKLPDGRARNPFGFSREPADEATLLRDLAANGLLPLPAWRRNARPVWDRAFQDLRAERANALGLVRPASPNSGT